MRRILPLSALLLALAAAYSGYWFWTAARLRNSITPWVDARRAQGYLLRWDAVAVGGFPAAFRLQFRNAHIAGSKPVPFAITADTLIGEARPWSLGHWRVTAPAGAHIAAPDRGAAFDAAAFDGSVVFGAAGPAAIHATAHDVSGSGLAQGLHITEADAQVTLPDRRPVDHRDAAFAVALRLGKIDLPRPVPSFGSTIDALALSGTIKGALPAGPLRNALVAWRDDGGIIELADGSLRWGTLSVTASGTLALDEALQPIGALTATIDGQNAIVDAVVAGGGLPAGEAHFAKIFLGLLAKPGADGKRHLVLPLRLQQDRVYLGPAQIAALPRFTWE